ncbi:uncharacterized mitochondrial protein-like protein, partial [Tanacetum coccineum]
LTNPWGLNLPPHRLKPTKAYPISTPIEIKDKLDLDKNGTLVDATKYHSMIGALMYLTSSRPEIVYATCLCARYQAQPTEKHLKEVKRIFRYLWGTVNIRWNSILRQKVGADPRRNKIVHRCQPRKQNMCLYPLVVNKSFG